MKHRVLLVEDELGIRLSLGDRLHSVGYDVATAADGKKGYELALQGGLDLIILDLILPEKNGLEICKELRRVGIDTPILMLTAKAQMGDKLTGFRLGADDYLTKPFDMRELLARSDALLRRGDKWSELSSCTVYEFGDMRLDTRQTKVWRAGKAVVLSMKEYELLHFFVTHPRETLSRDRLLRDVWKYDDKPPSRTVDVHVGWLRKKIERDPRRPRWIRTVYGMGYQFDPGEEDDLEFEPWNGGRPY